MTGFRDDAPIDIHICMGQLDHGKATRPFLTIADEALREVLVEQNSSKSAFKSLRIIGFNKKSINFVSRHIHISVECTSDDWCGGSHGFNKNHSKTFASKRRM